MATIVKRARGYQAQVYYNHQRRAKTFVRKEDAKRWADATLAEMQSGEPAGSRLTLSELCLEYERLEAPKKGNQRYNAVKLRWWGATRLGQLRASEITARQLQDFVDERTEQVQPSSARREFVLLQSVFSWALRKRLLITNPCKDVKKPQDNPPRERVATAEEIEMLKTAVGWEVGDIPSSAIQRSVAAFVLSCLTGMRGGEILRIRNSFIDWQKRVITLPAVVTKTRTRRLVAFGSEAETILRSVVSLGNDPIFGLADEVKDTLFRKARDRAGLGEVVDGGIVIRQALHFHDARATFCTWAASPGEDGAPHLDVLTLAKQIGHKNLKQLMTYFRPKPEEIAKRLV